VIWTLDLRVLLVSTWILPVNSAILNLPCNAGEAGDGQISNPTKVGGSTVGLLLPSGCGSSLWRSVAANADAGMQHFIISGREYGR